MRCIMNRRDFLGATGAAGYLAMTAQAQQPQPARSPRVGLIGCGWYGTCDLLRLIQVAPVEVVSLCDVDSMMMKETSGLVAQRQASKKEPRHYRDYRDLLKEKDLDVVLIGTPDHWHALTMI